MNERFSCVRLSMFPRWEEKIDDFENEMNPNLVDYLKSEAFEEDSEDWNAVYLILDKLHDDNIIGKRTRPAVYNGARVLFFYYKLYDSPTDAFVNPACLNDFFAKPEKHKVKNPKNA